MNDTQEPKYEIRDGKIVNRESGEAIPDDEPIMIFRGRDKHAQAAIRSYAAIVQDPNHKAIVLQRADDFAAFEDAHPTRVKEPDTVLPSQG